VIRLWLLSTPDRAGFVPESGVKRNFNDFKRLSYCNVAAESIVVIWAAIGGG
jgi:hypothetical protein